jgi:hypothetical protein
MLRAMTVDALSRRVLPHSTHAFPLSPRPDSSDRPPPRMSLLDRLCLISTTRIVYFPLTFSSRATTLVISSSRVSILSSRRVKRRPDLRLALTNRIVTFSFASPSHAATTVSSRQSCATTIVSFPRVAQPLSSHNTKPPPPPRRLSPPFRLIAPNPSAIIATSL